MEESNKAQHREFVQTAITRMNTNSFQLKAMMITITAAFLAVFGANSKSVFILIPIPIVFLFWFLDAYYLQMERKFRAIYRDICDLTSEDEKLTTSVFQMNPKLYKGWDYSFLKVFLWSSIAPLYLFIIASLTIVYLKLTCIV